MIKKLIIVILIASGLSAEITGNSAVDYKLEFGIYAPDTSGTIKNVTSSSSFKEDYKYEDLKASYFAAEVVSNRKYIPNIRLSYFTMNDNKASDVNTTVREVAFDGAVESTLDYSVLSAVFYKDFKIKGDSDDLFYSGDFQFDIGANFKMLEWKFAMNNSTQNAWIKVSERILLPYIGFKYHLYGFSAYANASALAIGNAESHTYNYGVEFEVVNNLYIGAGYIDEHFEVVEKTETVSFDTTGYKVSFKYVF